MKKRLLIISAAVLISSGIQGENSYWNGFKNIFGYGTPVITTSNDNPDDVPLTFTKNYMENPYHKRYFSIAKPGDQPFYMDETQVPQTALQKLEWRAENLLRRQGATNTLLAAAAIGAAGYGLYKLYNWSRGNLHGFKKDINAAKKNINQAKERIEKEEENQSNIDIKKTLIKMDNDLANIYKSIEDAETPKKTTNIPKNEEKNN